MQTATTEAATKPLFHERPTAPIAVPKKRLVEAMAEKYGVDPDKMLATLKATVFKGDVSNEQMMMLLVVANEYNLNPFTREIYAFPSKQGIVPIVSIDGWIRIVNEHPMFRGVGFEYGPPSEDKKFHGAPEWVQCTMVRSDRDMPVDVREYLVECYRSTEPWNTATARMLRHRAYIQCGRVAFGFALHDEDEAERIIQGESTRVPEQPPAIGRINAEVSGKTIEGEATVTTESAAPETVIVGTRQGSAPTHDDIAAAIDKAQTAADMELAGDLVRSHKDDAERGQLALRLDKRRDDLAAKRK